MFLTTNVSDYFSLCLCLHMISVNLWAWNRQIHCKLYSEDKAHVFKAHISSCQLHGVTHAMIHLMTDTS